MCGKKWKEKMLYVHHIKPVTHHERGQEREAARRENLCALCKGCHRVADHYALEKGIYLYELKDLMQQDLLMAGD